MRVVSGISHEGESAWIIPSEAICPKDQKSLNRYEQYKGYYAVKHAIAREVAPKRILEIGVRAGYSALAFMTACPKAEYVGVDAETGKHGGEGGPWMWWAKTLLKGFNVNLYKLDSQQLDALPEHLGNFDFVHVDGDHSFEGALHDMELCWPKVNVGGAMLVDDYDYLWPVHEAIEEFRKRVDDWYEDGVSEYRKSLRGEVIFRKMEYAGL